MGHVVVDRGEASGIVDDLVEGDAEGQSVELRKVEGMKEDVAGPVEDQQQNSLEAEKV